MTFTDKLYRMYKMSIVLTLSSCFAKSYSLNITAFYGKKLHKTLESLRRWEIPLLKDMGSTLALSFKNSHFSLRPHLSIILPWNKYLRFYRSKLCC